MYGRCQGRPEDALAAPGTPGAPDDRVDHETALLARLGQRYVRHIAQHGLDTRQILSELGVVARHQLGVIAAIPRPPAQSCMPPVIG